MTENMITFFRAIGRGKQFYQRYFDDGKGDREVTGAELGLMTVPDGDQSLIKLAWDLEDQPSIELVHRKYRMWVNGKELMVGKPLPLVRGKLNAFTIRNTVFVVVVGTSINFRIGHK